MAGIRAWAVLATKWDALLLYLEKRVWVTKLAQPDQGFRVGITWAELVWSGRRYLSITLSIRLLNIYVMGVNGGRRVSIISSKKAFS
jgi:hypothetical protein